MKVVHNEYATSQEQTNVENETDTLEMLDPSPAGDDLAGRIRRIQNLINQRQSVDAIALAMETLKKYAGAPEASLEKIYTQIENSAAFIHINGTQHEADIAKRLILENINLSSRWGDNLLESISIQGFASVIHALRAENTSDVNGPSMGVNRSAVPTLGLAA